MRQAMKLVMIAGAIVALPAFRTAQRTAATWPGTWPPPPGMNCPRYNTVPWLGAWNVASHLTDLHESPTCVPQPACVRQRAPQQIYLGPVWMGSPNHQFTIAQQDTVMINARSYALAQSPGGKQLYRLTFQKQFVSPNGFVIAYGDYGYCVTIVKVDPGPTDPR